MLLNINRTVPKTTSGKIARSMCKRAHVAGTLEKDTLFLWGESVTATPAVRDKHAEEAESALNRGFVGEGEAGYGDGRGGVEESKGGGRTGGDPRGMTEAEVLVGVQHQVARILKADAGSIPTVSAMT